MCKITIDVGALGGAESGASDSVMAKFYRRRRNFVKFHATPLLLPERESRAIEEREKMEEKRKKKERKRLDSNSNNILSIDIADSGESSCPRPGLCPGHSGIVDGAD